jgi:uncharacterized protein (TIGR03086 family)
MFDRGLESFLSRVRKAGSDGWGRSTPCDEWDVRALVNHVVGELLWAPPLVEGQSIEQVGDRFEGDVLGADPAATAAAAADGARSAFRAPGALEGTVHLSFGDFSGNDYCWQLIADLTVHSWDLARGLDVDDALDEQLVRRVIEVMGPMFKQFSGSAVFGEQVDVPADAPIQDQLVAATGRTP